MARGVYMAVPSIQQNGDDGPPRKQGRRMSSFVRSPPQLTKLPFLKMGYRRAPGHQGRAGRGAVLLLYLNSRSNHPRDTVRSLT